MGPPAKSSSRLLPLPSTSRKMDLGGKLHFAVGQHKTQIQDDILFSHVLKSDFKPRIVPIISLKDREGHLQTIGC